MAKVQAVPGGEDAAAAIGVDGTAFERPVDVLVPRLAEHAALDQPGNDAVILAGLEFPTPSVEAKIVEDETIFAKQGDRTGVAQPGVIVGNFNETQARSRQVMSSQALLGTLAHGFVGHQHDGALEAGDRGNQGGVGRLHLLQAVSPIGFGVWPGKQDRCLRLPLRGQAHGRIDHRFGNQAPSRTLWMTVLPSK